MNKLLRSYNANSKTAKVRKSQTHNVGYDVELFRNGEWVETKFVMEFSEACRDGRLWVNEADAVKSEDPAVYITTPPAQHVEAAENRVIADALAILERRMVRGETFTDPTTAGNYFRVKLNGEAREKFLVALLDTRHRLIVCEELFAGTIDGCEVHPRIVAEFALRNNAAAVILAHNHPSGVNEPSAADRAVTARIKQALALIEVRVLDHFIVSDYAPALSMAARGLV